MVFYTTHPLLAELLEKTKAKFQDSWLTNVLWLQDLTISLLIQLIDLDKN